MVFMILENACRGMPNPQSVYHIKECEMRRLADLNLRPKLVILFVLTGLIPLGIAGYYGSLLAIDALMDKSFSQLVAVQTIRTGQLESAFEQRARDLKKLCEDPRLAEMVRNLQEFHNAAVPDDKITDALTFGNYTQPLERFIDSYGCQDLKIMAAEACRIMYAREKGTPLWTDLTLNEFSDTGLVRVWQQVAATGKGAIADFEPFEPAGGTETAFFGQPVKNADGIVVAVVVIQVTPAFISRIMESRKGMGQTGESYILDWDRTLNRFELRSDIKTMGDGRYVIGFSLDRSLDYWEDAVKMGMEGGSGTYADSAGNSVLAAYNRLDIPGLTWFLISKIDKYEVEEPVRFILYRTLILSVILVTVIGIGAFYLSRSITRPIIEDVRFAQAISQGQLDQTLRLDRRDELGKLAYALNHMARTLYDLDWLQKGKQGLDDALRGELSDREMGSRFIAFMVKHLDAQMGALYVNNQNTLQLTATYAFTDRSGNFNTIDMGQGMVGQAALEREIIIFNDTTEDGPVINYGAGERQAAAYMIVPLIYETHLLGVFIVGSVDRFTPLQKRFVEQNASNTAILMNTVQSRRTIEKLLEKAQAQQKELLTQNETLEQQTRALKESEAELQAQQEELRVTNEELEEQTRALKASEEELQAQQEELRVTNEELENHAKAMEEQAEALDRKNTDLTQAQEDIRKKAEELEIASKYKSEFLANMSHELRTPLNSILILSQLLAGNKDGNLTEKQMESAGAIHSSGEDLLTLINEILDLSKVEAGKIELLLEDVEIRELREDVNRMFKDLAREKGVAFDIRLSQDLPALLHTDPLRLSQILRNLLTNAFKFTPQGAVTLSIGRPEPALLRGSDLAGDTAVALAVRDDGIGISREKQAVIFEAFQQADGSTSRNYGGTGLGLSISRELARLLGGFIHLQSEAGKGSTFTVVIPERLVSDQPDAPGETVQAPLKTAATPSESGGPAESREEPPPDLSDAFVRDDRKSAGKAEKILLIIEDDTNSARIMRDFARDRGFSCIIAEDGETGLHFADYYRPSAIILDIGLPGIDGWTVLERLKNNPDLRHIPVHFMSADDYSLEAMRMGAVGFLTKPVTMKKVDDTFVRLENIINRKVRKLLVVEDDATQQQSIRELIGNGDVETVTAATGSQAFEILTQDYYDCMILDLGLEDMSGFDLLEKIRQTPACAALPVIVYTGRDLTRDEEKALRKYTESIIIKGAKSPERLLEESALFLHRVETSLPEEQQTRMKLVHDKETVLTGKSVLLVDDDMRNVFALSSVLEEKNMTVVIARDGAEGVEKIKSHTEIDVVLMDIMMPKMDGYEAMREIRKTHRDLPIIALTAKAMKGDRNKCIDAGASDYLAKPVDTDKLISMLRVWLYA